MIKTECLTFIDLIFLKSKFKWIYVHYIINCPIGLLGRVFVNGLGDRGSIPGWVILKNQKIVLDISLLNSQYYKGKVEQSKEKSSALHYTSVL